jgi:hypothetical protein
MMWLRMLDSSNKLLDLTLIYLTGVCSVTTQKCGGSVAALSNNL